MDTKIDGLVNLVILPYSTDRGEFIDVIVLPNARNSVSRSPDIQADAAARQAAAMLADFLNYLRKTE